MQSPAMESCKEVRAVKGSWQAEKEVFSSWKCGNMSAVCVHNIYIVLSGCRCALGMATLCYSNTGVSYPSAKAIRSVLPDCLNFASKILRSLSEPAERQSRKLVRKCLIARRKCGIALKLSLRFIPQDSDSLE